jgi:hypothetical protein
MSRRAAPATPRIRRVAFLVTVVALVLASASVPVADAGTSGARVSAKRVVTVYSIATGLQYINSTDDSARGHVNNPLDSTANKLAPKSSSGGDGPFAGDIAVYSVALYSNPTLTRHAGSGVYTCYFNYDKHALCQAYYKLKAGGTLVASGPIDFQASGFTIVMTGGTNTYLGARGEVDVAGATVAAAKKKNAQKVDFEMIG